jgi:hypothetical protein
MTGEQLRAQLTKRPADSDGQLLKPVTVEAKHRIKDKVIKERMTITRVYPRAYMAATGEVKAFWPLYDCVIV